MVILINDLTVTLGNISELQEALLIIREVVKKSMYILSVIHPKTVAIMRNLESITNRVNLQ